MLTPLEIEELRDTVQRHQRPPGDCDLVPFAGGPLDGLVLPLDVIAQQSEFIGWAKQAAAGLVQVVYVPAEDGTRRFLECVLTSTGDDAGHARRCRRGLCFITWAVATPTTAPHAPN